MPVVAADAGALDRLLRAHEKMFRLEAAAIVLVSAG